jgi:hypothetical protein
MGSPPREFDLNVEEVLEHWTIPHAIRELIANALDEQVLTGTREPEITTDGQNSWHIRDWGRGLKYEHLTQKENNEKLDNADRVVGKFGVGLKDALATFYRHGIHVTIRSRHNDITLTRVAKHGFADIATLHAVIHEPNDPGMVGTDVVLEGVTRDQVDEAKSLFLHYSGDQILEDTAVGSVLHKGESEARVYVNGLRVAHEPNFLFSYNITSPTKALREALNRERSHVGRSAYTERIKTILLGCRSANVAEMLAADFELFATGSMHDELQWIDIGLHACRVLSANQQVIFLTTNELLEAGDFVERARGDGYRPVVVPDNIRRKLPGLEDIAGNPVRDLTVYRQEWDDSFEFRFVEPEELGAAERAVWARTDDVFTLAGGRPGFVRSVRISQTMRLQSQSYREAVGVWDPGSGSIIVKRTQLRSLADYAGTLLHELAHARSGASDLSAAFEDALTIELGQMAARSMAN